MHTGTVHLLFMILLQFGINTMHVRFACALVNYTSLFKYLFAYLLFFTHMLRHRLNCTES